LERFARGGRLIKAVKTSQGLVGDAGVGMKRFHWGLNARGKKLRNRKRGGQISDTKKGGKGWTQLSLDRVGGVPKEDEKREKVPGILRKAKHSFWEVKVLGGLIAFWGR